MMSSLLVTGPKSNDYFATRHPPPPKNVTMKTKTNYDIVGSLPLKRLCRRLKLAKHGSFKRPFMRFMPLFSALAI